MGTRSRIGVMHGDVCKSIYVHWDGYLRGAGRTLLDHYDSAKANHLVALGDASSLAQEIEIPEGVAHSFNAPNENITAFYGRDRGSADSYYGRKADPHYWPFGTYKGTRIEAKDMTPAQIAAYRAGYDYNEQSGDKKNWG